MSETTIDAVGKLTFEDGTVEHLDDTHMNRVVYALTTLALHRAIAHVKIIRAENAKGKVLWSQPKR